MILPTILHPFQLLQENDGFDLVCINIPVSGKLSKANVMFLQLIRCDDIYGLLDFAFGDSVGLEMIFRVNDSDDDTPIVVFATFSVQQLYQS